MSSLCDVSRVDHVCVVVVLCWFLTVGSLTLTLQLLQMIHRSYSMLCVRLKFDALVGIWAAGPQMIMIKAGLKFLVGNIWIYLDSL